ncbi:parB-like partition protein [Clostridium tetanomorphum]|nr:parB-like partition protein [Clostridium tetanomorphum]
MNKKFGLGKGLGALIPEEIDEDITSSSELAIDLIKPNSKQPRKKFDEEGIIQLSESIKEHGIIQPLIVKKKVINILLLQERDVGEELKWLD